MQAKDLKVGDLIKITKCRFGINSLYRNYENNNNFYIIILDNNKEYPNFSILLFFHKGKIFSRVYSDKTPGIEFIPFEKINL